MGIDLWNLRFLLEAHKRHGDFGDMLQIGRQEIHIGHDAYPIADRMLRQYGFDIDFERARRSNAYADEGLFQLLGATHVQAADASPYEGAAIVHDFNDPISPREHLRWDTIFDGGSLEHIFNVPIALANEMNMLKVGGRLLSALPANNWLGHGFYQFSQELPFRVFTRANGFDLSAVLFSAMLDEHELRDVTDMRRKAGGEMLLTQACNSIMFMARKTAHARLFAKWPQQSDYSDEWESFSAAHESA